MAKVSVQTVLLSSVWSSTEVRRMSCVAGGPAAHHVPGRRGAVGVRAASARPGARCPAGVRAFQEAMTSVAGTREPVHGGGPGRVLPGGGRTGVRIGVVDACRPGRRSRRPGRAPGDRAGALGRAARASRRTRSRRGCRRSGRRRPRPRGAVGRPSGVGRSRAGAARDGRGDRRGEDGSAGRLFGSAHGRVTPRCPRRAGQCTAVRPLWPPMTRSCQHFGPCRAQQYWSRPLA